MKVMLRKGHNLFRPDIVFTVEEVFPCSSASACYSQCLLRRYYLVADVVVCPLRVVILEE